MGWNKRRDNYSSAIKFALLGAGVAGACVGLAVWSKSERERRNRNLKRGQRIVILGGGFAGANAALELARLLPQDEDAQITLVDSKNFMLFTPMLTEVAGGQVEVSHIVRPLRDLSSRIVFQEGRIDSIDLANKSVTLTIGDDAAGLPTRKLTLTADHLVIALGTVPNYHHIPGVEENSLAVKTLEDAAAIRNRILALLERVDSEPDPDRRRELLTVVVGGGGYTGVETMAAVNDLLRERAKQYAHINVDDIRTVLVVPEDTLLSELKAPSLAAYAQKELQRRGVEVLLKTKITGAGEDYVEMEGGQRITTHTLIWAAGITPSPVIGTLDCKRGKSGGIIVDSCCAVPDHPGIWALGDCAEIPEPGKSVNYAPTAQNATREGTAVARNIVAVLRGEQPKPFQYTPIGELALVGKRVGIAEVYGVRVSGYPAWAMWRAVYLMKTPDAKQRLHVLIDWLMDLFFTRSIARLPLTRSKRETPNAEITRPQAVPTPVAEPSS